jgi:hypothetical protein
MTSHLNSVVVATDSTSKWVSKYALLNIEWGRKLADARFELLMSSHPSLTRTEARLWEWKRLTEERMFNASLVRLLGQLPVRKRGHVAAARAHGDQQTQTLLIQYSHVTHLQALVEQLRFAMVRYAVERSVVPFEVIAMTTEQVSDESEPSQDTDPFEWMWQQEENGN